MARPVRNPSQFRASTSRSRLACGRRKSELSNSSVHLEPFGTLMSSERGSFIDHAGERAKSSIRAKPKWLCRVPRARRGLRPASLIENTIIGILFSRASAKAAVSMTARFLAMASIMCQFLCSASRPIAFRVRRIAPSTCVAFHDKVAGKLGAAQGRPSIGRERRNCRCPGQTTNPALAKDDAKAAWRE